jgi:hypothetical protein
MKNENNFFKALEHVDKSDWKVKFQDGIPLAEMGAYTACIYLLDSSSGWIGAGCIKPEDFGSIAALYKSYDLDQEQISDMVGQAILALGENRSTNEDPMLAQAVQLAAAAFTGTQTFALASKKTLAGHWIYLTYKVRNGSILTRPIYFNSLSPGFIKNKDLLSAESSVGRALASGGGADISPIFTQA